MAATGTDRVTLVGESFGALVALRVAAAAPVGAVDTLTLLNSATAVARRSLPAVTVRALSPLLPLLQADLVGGRLFYTAAATQAPLGATLHRTRLIRQFVAARWADDAAIIAAVAGVRGGVGLVASGRDRLLPSVAEADRLARVLRGGGVPVWRTTLPESAHACLLEQGVALVELLKVHDTPAGGADATRARRSAAPEAPPPPPRPVPPSAEAAAAATAAVEPPAPLPPPPPPGAGARDAPPPAAYARVALVQKVLTPLRVATSPFSAALPGWGALLADLGAVVATPRNYVRLLASGQPTLLFPGGAREVATRTDDARYQLHWEEGSFVRAAARHGALIIPVASVGVEDATGIVAAVEAEIGAAMAYRRRDPGRYLPGRLVGGGVDRVLGGVDFF
ncbi:hypothetical protein I4F81_010500 [Pyropia yezoensis]|uniref:Uncharacterized protein n=1 Tax=Pyropia yezoensis TaxID=2788 RepID=A0ACC3CDT8_PYRYE|nr:hypothetical protein I4F81_010500 [Neopyropia yezoensis]